MSEGGEGRRSRARSCHLFHAVEQEAQNRWRERSEPEGWVALDFLIGGPEVSW
jgi:hypothetical protein